jgi:sulfate permease, SulP family
MEYATIASIMVAMTVWDFVTGVFFGIVVSCFFFVVQNSQRRSVRALYTGESVVSTVRRPSIHREYIRDVARQTTIMRLQGPSASHSPRRPRRSSTFLMHTSGWALTGFLFFGTITHVEETIRTLVDGAAWQRSPIRFLVLDFSLVAGVDMSAAEAFVRVHRILSTRGVVLCFCGIAAGSPVCSALASVGLLEAEGVKLFASFNDALECESPDPAGSHKLLCS